VDFGDLQAAAAANGPFITAVTIFLIAWFTNMAVTGWLAGRRNREGGLWAAFAFFAGPLALLALLALPRKKTKPALSPLWAQHEESAVDTSNSAPEGGRALRP
jgi:hypothetical protein